ncbi:MAG: hypothetical protein E7119_08985 [Bacteroidales bacterium]|nr:hypothetical protein [Bacteroidales bacterium]
MKKFLFMIIAIFLTSGVANAQLGKLGSKLKKGLNAVTEEVNKATSSQNQQQSPNSAQTAVQGIVGQQAGAKPGKAGFDEFSASNIPSNALYVTLEHGSARGTGTKESPLKDIQKAIDLAPDGGVVCIAEGNYLGTLDRGWIEIKGKYVSLVGGFNQDFTERDPQKYVTRIQPGIQQRGSIGMGLLMLECTANMNTPMAIDGICFDLGNYLEYCPADPTDERWGCPEGCETGRVKPISEPPNSAIRSIGGNFAGSLTIRNCMFTNSSFYGILLISKGGNWEIYNNVFVGNIYASCEVNGGLNQSVSAHCSTVDFHHNTVLFSWCATKEMEDMGYGYRMRNGVDHNVHNNIFGCNNMGAIDAAWDDSNLPADKRKILNAYDNLFFMNQGDITVAGTSGGKWLFVPAKRFDEVMSLTKYENNRELPSTSNFKDFIIEPYLKGFATLKIMTTTSYDPNSAANLYREAHGLNKQGTSTTRVSMYGNRYNFDQALLLFGAEEGYGAQKIK